MTNGSLRVNGGPAQSADIQFDDVKIQLDMGSASAPLPVEIVRPKMTIGAAAGQLMGSWAALAIRAWALTILFGLMHERISPAIPALGFWDASLVLAAVLFLAPHRDNGLWWISRQASKS